MSETIKPRGASKKTRAALSASRRTLRSPSASRWAVALVTPAPLPPSIVARGRPARPPLGAALRLGGPGHGLPPRAGRRKLFRRIARGVAASRASARPAGSSSSSRFPPRAPSGAPPPRRPRGRPASSAAWRTWRRCSRACGADLRHRRRPRRVLPQEADAPLPAEPALAHRPPPSPTDPGVTPGALQRAGSDPAAPTHSRFR